MQASDIPSKFQAPFGNAAGAGYIRTIPATQPVPGNGQASLATGFPPETFTPPDAGGYAPDGRDFNGLLNLISAWSRWQAAGGPLKWDSTFNTAIGGYPQGAVVASATTLGLFWLCLADNNTTNPDSSGANWVAWPLSTGQASPVLVPTIASLRALTSTALGTQIYVQGYYNEGDGGDGFFWYNPSDTSSADNGGTIIVDAASHRWYRQTSGQFYPAKWFGARGDNQQITNGAMAVSSTILTSVSGVFQTADIGKAIVVNGAGASGADLVTTITGFTNSNAVTLNSPNGSGSNLTGLTVNWGNDDTAAIQAAMNSGFPCLIEGWSLCASGLIYSDTYGMNLIGQGRGLGTRGIISPGSPFVYRSSMSADTIINTKNYIFQNGASSNGLQCSIRDLSVDASNPQNTVALGVLWTPSASLTWGLDADSCDFRGYVGRHLQWCNSNRFVACYFYGTFAAHAATMPPGLSSNGVIEKVCDIGNGYFQTPAGVEASTGSIWYDNDQTTAGGSINGITEIECTFEYGYQWLISNALNLQFTSVHVERITDNTLLVVNSNGLGLGNILISNFDGSGITETQLNSLLALLGISVGLYQSGSIYTQAGLFKTEVVAGAIGSTGTTDVFQAIYNSATQQGIAIKNTASGGHLWRISDNPGPSTAAGQFGISDLTAGPNRLLINGAGSVVIGVSAPATTATDGFLNIPVQAGTPTGTPTHFIGFSPIVYDSTGHKIWVYDFVAAAWKGVAVS